MSGGGRKGNDSFDFDNGDSKLVSSNSSISSDVDPDSESSSIGFVADFGDLFSNFCFLRSVDCD